MRIIIKYITHNILKFFGGAFFSPNGIIISETRDEEVVETLVSSIVEGQHTISPSYQLARDRFGREIAPPQRYSNVDLICYDLNVAKGLQDSKSKNFKEALSSKDGC